MHQPGGSIGVAAHHGGAGSSCGAQQYQQQHLLAGRPRAGGIGGGGAAAASLALPVSSQPRTIPSGGRGGRGGRGASSTSTRAGATATAVTATATTAAAAAPSAAATPPAAGAPLPDLGFPRGLEDKYEWGRELGRGGNGVVRVVRDRATGEEWACKSLPKAAPAGAGDRKRAGHLEALRREVEVLRRLDGSLNVVRLVDVREDDTHVHLVQEWCKGGELHHRVGGGGGGGSAGKGASGGGGDLAARSQQQHHHHHHYSERTVASFMRAVLRTLAQCHAQHILHRDVKPGNFMLLDGTERSPLRAIDFGLATPFEPDALPLDNLGLEGTPWFMAPEVLSSKVTPASDVWSAGVVAAQLLTGRLPFDDHRNPVAPSLSAVWRSVLTDEINYNMPWWRDVSPEARGFVARLLDRDPARRPSAREALADPWLRGDSKERGKGRPLDASVVQRLQRFAQNSRFKRSVLQLIAEELLAASPSVAGGRAAAQAAAAAAEAAAARGGGASPLSCSASSAGGGGARSVGADEGGGSTLHSVAGAAASLSDANGSGHGGNHGGSNHGSAGSAGSGALVISRPDAPPLLALFDRLAFGSADFVDRRQAEEALARMGYRLDPSELGRLVDVVDTSHSGRVRRAALAASQIDWRALQRGTGGSAGSGGTGAGGGKGAGGGGAGGGVRDEWLDVAARAFRALDRDGDGLLKADDIVASLRVKLPEDELRAALAQVMAEAAAGGAAVGGGLGGGGAFGAPGVGGVGGAVGSGVEALDFDGFLRVLRVSSFDSLDLYDDRLTAFGGSGGSGHGGGGGAGNSSHGRGRAAAAAAAIAAASELTAAASGAESPGKPWLRPHVTFNFNFGGGGGDAAAAAGTDAEAGEGGGGGAAAAGGAAANDGDFAASYFGGGAGEHKGESRMHGASLYRNAAVGGGRPMSHSLLQLATVRE